MKKNLRIITSILSTVLVLTVSSGCTFSNERREKVVVSEGNKLSEREITIKVMRLEHPMQPLKSDSPALKEIYKKTGVRVEIEAVPTSSYIEKKRTLIATNNIPDVIFINKTDLRDFGSTGIFLPLLKLIDENAPNFKKLMLENPDIKKLYNNDELYAFPIMDKNGPVSGRVPVIRTDLLKKLNLKTPENFDQLYDVLKKFKEAYPESHPWTTRGGSASLIHSVAYPMGIGYGIYFDKDIDGGKYIYGTCRPEFKEVLEYFNKLYKDKILDPDYSVNTAQQWQEKMNSGKSFFYYDNPSFAINANIALQSKNSDYRFDVIPIFKNKQGTRRNLSYERHHWDELYAISSKVKNTNVVIKFFDWLYSEEGSNVTSFGVLDEHYTNVNGQLKVSEKLIAQYSTTSDPIRAMQSALGTGLLSFCPYVNWIPEAQITPPDAAKWNELLANDKAMIEPILDPPFTKEEIEKLKMLNTQVSTIINRDIDKFMMGIKPLSEFDALAQKARESGALEIEKIYNTANARTK